MTLPGPFAAADTPLTPIADVLAVGAGGEATFGGRIRIRGVVTWRSQDAAFVEDDTGSIYVDLWKAMQRGLTPRPTEFAADVAPGSVVEIDGITDRAGYSPAILPHSIAVSGTAAPRPPTELDSDLFFSGFQEGKRLTVEAIVQAVRDDGREWRFIVEHGGRRFSVQVEKQAFGDDPQSLVDALVRIEGVAVATFNPRGEFIWPRLAANGRADFTLVAEPPAPAFESPSVPLPRIATYRPQPSRGHRIRTRGTVIHTVPGQFFFLQDEAIGVRVETTSREPLAIGDRVEVAAFLNRASPAAMLVEAVYRRTGNQETVVPLTVDAETIVARVNARFQESVVGSPGDYEGCLVTFPARVLWMNAVEDGGLVVLSAGESSLIARAGPGVFTALSHVRPGSDVQVTGVASIERADRPDVRSSLEWPTFDRLTIFLRSPADLAVVRAPSYWTPSRLRMALLGVAALTGTVTLWAIALKRQVGHQLAVIQRQIKAEAAMDERQRIAQEFHDTLEQDLAGVAMRLDVAAERAGDEASRATLESQRAMLDRLRSDTHDFVWDLRDAARQEGPLRDAVAEQVASLELPDGPRIECHASGGNPLVSPFVQHHLLRIVRESVANAVKHARASRVDVRVTAADGRAIVEISDDGRGFDIDARGSVPGHFGIRGMRERARRIGATIDIGHRAGGGTTVRVTAPTIQQQNERQRSVAGVRS